jgi:hypothetical protein
LLTLGVVLWCALSPGCSGPAESTTNAPGMSIAGSGAGDAGHEAGAPGEDDEARAPGEDDVPDSVDAQGGGGSTAREPASSSAGASAGADESSDGGARTVALGVGGEASAGSVTDPEPDPLPTCGKQPDGTLCGLNMTPAGPEGERYFCSAGLIIAEAACPGPCDVETNACVQSGGTGGGSGETSFHTVLRCRACYASQCRQELVTCEADPLCVAHLECFETCSLDHTCYATCESVFKSEPLFDELNACVEETGCANKCPAD